jgi:hypothetical protein
MWAEHAEVLKPQAAAFHNGCFQDTMRIVKRWELQRCILLLSIWFLSRAHGKLYDSLAGLMFSKLHKVSLLDVQLFPCVFRLVISGACNHETTSVRFRRIVVPVCFLVLILDARNHCNRDSLCL